MCVTFLNLASVGLVPNGDLVEPGTLNHFKRNLQNGLVWLLCT